MPQILNEIHSSQTYWAPAFSEIMLGWYGGQEWELKNCGS